MLMHYFHTAICFWAKTNCIYVIREIAFAIFSSHLRDKSLRNGGENGFFTNYDRTLKRHGNVAANICGDDCLFLTSWIICILWSYVEECSTSYDNKSIHIHYERYAINAAAYGSALLTSIFVRR